MIKFERDKDGRIIAVNEKGEKIGTVTSMGDDLRDKPKQEAPDEKVDH